MGQQRGFAPNPVFEKKRTWGLICSNLGAAVVLLGAYPAGSSNLNLKEYGATTGLRPEPRF